MTTVATSNRVRSSESRCRRRGLTLAEVLITLAVLALLVALLLPAQRSAREPSRRTWCKNNLKQILLALHNYHDAFGGFPPAYTVDADDRPLHSWRTLILPYVDQAPLYDKIDLTKPWDDPANAAAREQLPQVYRCPSRNDPRLSTTYLALVAPGGCLQAGSSRRLDEITDGPSKTILLVEVDEPRAVHWMSPLDADEALFLALGAKSTSTHPGVFHVGLADGAVRDFSGETTAAERRSLMTIAGGD